MPLPSLSFGRTGHQSTRIIFGAASLSRVTQDDADRTLDVLLQHDINHIDVAASYGDAELRVAPWLRRMPGHFFLATKSGERRAEAAREELHRSLDRHADRGQSSAQPAAVRFRLGPAALQLPHAAKPLLRRELRRAAGGLCGAQR